MRDYVILFRVQKLMIYETLLVKVKLSMKTFTSLHAVPAQAINKKKEEKKNYLKILCGEGGEERIMFR